MIRTFRHKGLRELYETGSSRKISPDLTLRVRRRLTALDSAVALPDLNIPGFRFHVLRGYRPVRYSIHVNGPWRLTFEFEAGDIYKIDLEQYH